MSKKMQPTRVSKKQALAVFLALIVALFGLSGCINFGIKTVTLEPKISPPAIGTAGVLTVGVDSTRAPYAGMSRGNLVGIDVDIAAVIADHLGLKLKLVDIAGEDVDELLETGAIDMVMDVEPSGVVLSQGTEVGPYLLSGPAIFMQVKGTTVPYIDIRTLSGARIVCQADSLTAWIIDEVIGQGTSVPVPTLTDALTDVANGTATYAAADAVPGSFLALDHKDVSCVLLIPDSTIGVNIGVEKTNTELANALAVVLRTIRDNGELSVILTKWLGSISSIVVAPTQAIVSSNSPLSLDTEQLTNLDTGDDLPDPSHAGSA